VLLVLVSTVLYDTRYYIAVLMYGVLLDMPVKHRRDLQIAWYGTLHFITQLTPTLTLTLVDISHPHSSWTPGVFYTYFYL
jgi:hypothetical protein